MAAEPESFEHTPVLVDEVVRLFAPVPPGFVLDATVGGGGHAAAILGACGHLSLLGMDRDPRAVAAATRRLANFGSRARVVQARFDALAEVARSHGAEPVSGVLFDLGVSSPQLDTPERGFSYTRSGPLDMRMDPSGGQSAGDLLNTATVDELTGLIRRHGDERNARRVAEAIVAARPISTTGELADVVRSAIPAPARRRGGDPAKRTFQAIRIQVNDETEVLGPAVDQAVDLLAPRGRLVALTYHSGEDRIVARRMRQAASTACSCPPRMPCVCGSRPSLRIVRGHPERPGPDEQAANPRSASARLRAAEKLEVAAA